VTDDTVAIQAAWDAAGADDTVLYPPGRYAVTQVRRDDVSLRLVGYGATIIQTTNTQSHLLRGGYDTIESISSITATTYDFGQGTAIPCARLTLASVPASFTVGRIVRVVADDQTPGTRAAVGSAVARVGEYATIGAVVSNDVYLTGPLFNTYTTTPRVGLLSEVSFVVEGLTFEANEDDSGFTGFTVAQLEIRAAKDCTIKDVRCPRGWGAFATLVGVRGYTVHNATVEYLDDDPNNLRYGYGINDVSGDGALISSCRFGNLRHGVTTNCDQITAASSAIEYYGQSFGGRVVGCDGFGTHSTAFDTHLGAYDWEFDNCRAARCEIGYNARGKQIRFTNSTADRCFRGFQVSNDGAGSGGTTDIVLTNCRASPSRTRSSSNCVSSATTIAPSLATTMPSRGTRSRSWRSA
jgi:hypothetical protein